MWGAVPEVTCLPSPGWGLSGVTGLFPIRGSGCAQCAQGCWAPGWQRALGSESAGWRAFLSDLGPSLARFLFRKRGDTHAPLPKPSPSAGVVTPRGSQGTPDQTEPSASASSCLCLCYTNVLRKATGPTTAAFAHLCGHFLPRSRVRGARKHGNRGLPRLFSAPIHSFSDSPCPAAHRERL